MKCLPRRKSGVHWSAEYGVHGVLCLSVGSRRDATPIIYHLAQCGRHRTNWGTVFGQPQNKDVLSMNDCCLLRCTEPALYSVPVGFLVFV